MSKSHLLLYIFLVIKQVLILSQQTCKILALGGGGDKGAYQAGVIKGLVSSLASDLVDWDIITGISVGSLNGAGMVLFEKGNEQEAADYVISTWHSINGTNTIFQNWKPYGILGPLYGMLAKTSLYDTDPLRQFLIKLSANKTIKRTFHIGTTSVKDGSYRIYNNTYLEKNFVEGVLASAAFPVMFPNIKYFNESYMDGGIKSTIEVVSAINRCLDLGFDEKNIIVDVILCNNKEIDKAKLNSDLLPLQVLFRVFEIYSYDHALGDLKQIKDIFSKVNFRFTVEPSEILPSGVLPMHFDPVIIQKMIEIGIKDGKNAIKSDKLKFLGL